MASSAPESRLSPLQAEVLREFFRREPGFFLTGGGALAGFHLGHRTTDDLDLFTFDDAAFERGRFVLQDIASAMSGHLAIRQEAPGFLRAVLDRGGDAVVIDLVRDRHPQPGFDKLERDGIVIDSAAEILANKLTTLVGRAEERDLIDHGVLPPVIPPKLGAAVRVRLIDAGRSASSPGTASGEHEGHSHRIAAHRRCRPSSRRASCPAPDRPPASA